MHPIQRDILKVLSLNKEAKYSTLKGNKLEGNTFSYHLKSLLKDGYIKKKDIIYSLTPKGKLFVDKRSSKGFIERIQPKIITAIVLKNGNKYLLYKRKKEPFFNHIGLPHGKIHLEEKIKDAALRELEEKTGLKAKLRYRGHIYVTVHDETELVSSMLCHIFSGTQIEGDLHKEFSSGECFWSSIDEFKNNELLPGTKQILKLTKDNPNSIFFEEYFLNITDEV